VGSFEMPQLTGCLRWLRHAGAALILGCVVMAGGDAKCAAYGEANGLVAELVFPTVAKNVYVLKSSIDIKLTELPSIELLKSFPVYFERPRMLLTWGYGDRPAPDRLGIVRESKIGRQVLARQIPLHIEKGSYTTCRSLPAVFNGDDKFVSVHKEAVFPEPDVSTQLPFGSFLRVGDKAIISTDFCNMG
jgi:hypothetical protein